MKKLKFSTVFAFMENIHIIKDPGMIPYTMQSDYDYDVAVPLSDLFSYPRSKDYFQNIKTPIINDKTLAHRCINRFKWIKLHALDIDILNLFFCDKWTFFDLWIYLKRNPSGLVYIHTDSDGERLKNHKLFKRPLAKALLKATLLTEKNLQHVLWGVQNSVAASELNGSWPFYIIKYIPDGIHWEDNTPPKFEHKENIILTVARNGDPSKRTDILLEGWAQVANDFPDWKLRLVGSVDKNFEPYIEKFFSLHPELRSRTEFVGVINDRETLKAEYSRAKVFTLTSDWESFGIVTVEAMSRGCYIIGSDIPATSDLLDHGKYGTLFKAGNVSAFTEKLRQTLSNASVIEAVGREASTYASENFSWKNVLAPIDKWIKENHYDI